ncbi:hypothetical protein DENSPDRAFT_255715 [Dentipellis sp. KUC8613]|nr:hypothetical protein DENSPDRAFT_255715 [Dentipellis sp. KUC8613]
MKMHHYLRSWGLNVAKNAAFVQKTIDQVIDFAYVTICAKVSRDTADGRKRRLDKNALRWLGIKAFHTVFSHKPTAYKSILSRLHFQLSLSRNKTYTRRFRELTQEGNIMVVQLSF